MGKIIEMSAIVGMKSDSEFCAEENNTKKVIPFYQDGAHIGYIVTSPKTGRNVLIDKNENRFNGNTEFPTFERTVFVPEDSDFSEEHFMVLNGTVAYLEIHDNGSSELVDFYKLPECRWQSE